MNNEEKMNIILKARRRGFSAALKAKLGAEIKAGKVYSGMDYAHGKDKTETMRVITPFPSMTNRIIQKSLIHALPFPPFEDKNPYDR